MTTAVNMPSRQTIILVGLEGCFLTSVAGVTGAMPGHGSLRSERSGRLHQFVSDSPDCSLGPIGALDLPQQILDVFLDRLDADAQGAADFAVA